MIIRVKNKYRATFIILLIATMIFAAGFVFGAYCIRTPEAEAEESASGSVTEIITKAPEAEFKELTVTATAYCHCVKCCGKSDGITATGTRATAGRTIAVDPSVIPYGTEVIINGHTYIAEDCGGAIKGNKIDIYFDTHEEALQFGRQTLNVRYSV